MLTTSQSSHSLPQVVAPLLYSAWAPSVLPSTLRELAHASIICSHDSTENTKLVDTLDVPHEFQPYARLTESKLTYASIFSDFFYRMTDSTHDPQASRRLSAQAVSLVWISDCLIDDFSLPRELRLEVLDSLMRTLKDGVQFEYPFCNELTALSAVTAEMHRELLSLPHGDRVISSFEFLCHCAKVQITDPPSILAAEQLGASSFEVLARIPFAFRSEGPERILQATRPFGAILQLIDDLWDRDRDLRYGNHTFATAAEDLETLKYQVSARIDDLRHQMVAPLNASEARRFRALLGLTASFFTIKELAKRVSQGRAAPAD